MGNILQDMMGLLSRKKVVKEVESTDLILLGRTPNPDDSMFINPKMNNQLITIKDLKAYFDEGEISGGGTVDRVPIFTPDGTTLGDSDIIRTGLNAYQINNSLLVPTSLTTTNFYVSNIFAGTGDLVISATNFQLNDTVTGQKFISAQSNADVKLYFDSDLKLATVTDGVSITGKVTDLTNPTNPQDAATKAYVDAQSGSTQTTGTVTPTVSAGISGINYNDQTGYWTRIGDIVNVYIRVSIGAFTKTDPTQSLAIENTFPYDIDTQRYFFNADIMAYQNISDSGVGIPALYVARASASGAAAYQILFIRSANYALNPTNEITTNEMSTGGFIVELSYTYKASGNTIRTGATIDL